jgi:ribosomal protein S18 acetylase RimI-like enzyme
MKINVIRASRAHYNDIMKIYNDGFLPKFRFVTKKKEKQLSFFNDFGVVNIESIDKEFIAISEGKVLGILSLRFFNQRKDKFSPNLSYGKLFRKYGFISILKALILDLSFNHHPAKDELYIDSISVAEEARGRGVGTHLLNFSESFAKERDLKLLSLNVMYENNKAKKLYEKKGYKVKLSQSLWWFKKATGYSGAWFMVRNL